MDNSNLIHIHQNNRGFTLIEVLIAIILLAFISLYTFKMIDSSTETKDRVLREDQLQLQSLTFTSRLDSDISQIYSPLYSNAKANAATDPSAIYQDNASGKGSFDGKAKDGNIIPQFQSEDKSTLVFFTASNRRKVADAKDSRFAWVKYSLRHPEKSSDKNAKEDLKTENNKGEYEIVRQTIVNNIFASDLNWNDVKAQTLLTQVKSLEFSFWDEKSKKFVPSLQDLNENKNTIRSIKMDLVWVDEDNHEQKITKIFRVLYPYYNVKLDELNSGGAYGGSTPPPGVPNPEDATPPGGSDVNF